MGGKGGWGGGEGRSNGTMVLHALGGSRGREGHTERDKWHLTYFEPVAVNPIVTIPIHVAAKTNVNTIPSTITTPTKHFNRFRRNPAEAQPSWYAVWWMVCKVRAQKKREAKEGAEMSEVLA